MSHELQKRFLESLRGELRSNIKEFGKQLWEKDSEVFIFMARKAACFFDCLRELKITDVRGKAVSDRVLDMDLGWLRGKTVTLVDDCVFSGTTLFQARNTAIAAGCKSCDTMALSLNKKWLRPQLLPGGSEASDLNFVGPIFSLDDSDCVQQCFDIVRAISIFPRPYDVDFPHTRTSKLSSGDLHKLLHSPGWQAFDVSSNFQISYGVRTLTLIPNKHILHTFTDTIPGLNRLVQGAKIRLYARRMTNDTWSLRAVPIVMLGAVNAEILRGTAACWPPELTGAIRSIGASEPKPLYRLLHFITSWSLLRHFNAIVKEWSGVHLEDGLRTDLAEMSFGGAFKTLSDRAPDLFRSCEFPEAVEEPDSPAISKFGRDVSAVETPQALFSECVKPFTWLYRNLEIKAREIVLQDGLKASQRAENAQLTRLRKGFSPRRLIARLESSGFDVSKYVSLFLDKAVDLGIAVPTTVDDEGLLYRAFRHGEDAVFGEAEERLTILALQSYLNERKLTSIFGLELQKFVVLFIQIAVRDGRLIERLNTTDSVNSGCRVISVKGHLHGPVPMVATLDETATVGAPFVEGVDYPVDWLVDDWSQRGILTSEKTPTGRKYIIQKTPDLQVGARKEAQARKIGRCLGRVVGDKSANPPRPLNNDTDLVLLATCTEADHQIRALSGEVSIFLHRWQPTMDQVRQHARDGDFLSASEALLSANSLYTAVNSGAMKYRWFVDQRLMEIIKDTARYAEKHDATGDLVDEWLLLWPDFKNPTRVNTPAPTWNAIEAMGQWCIACNVVMRLFNYWIWLSNSNELSTNENKAKEAIVDCRKWCAHFKTYCSHDIVKPFSAIVEALISDDVIDNHSRTADLCKQATVIIEGQSVYALRSLLSDSRVLCETYGVIGDPRPFPYAVFIDIEGIKSDQDPYAQLLRSVQEFVDGDAQLLPDGHNPWKAGLWILLRGDRHSDKAAKLAIRIVAKFANTGVKYRMVLLGQLAYNESVRDISGSVKLALGDFPRRISLLAADILPAHYDNSVRVVSERREQTTSEGIKFRRILGQRFDWQKTVSSKDELLPLKEFDIYSLKPALPVKKAKGSESGRVIGEKLPPNLRLIAFATEWESKHGGLSTFNRDFCSAAAKAGARVVCCVPAFTASEQKRAKQVGVTLAKIGISDEKEVSIGKLPDDFTPNIVVGHDRITGPVCLSASGKHFKQAKRILFIHTTPEEIEPYKESRHGDSAVARAAVRKTEQLELADEYDLVAAVGPHLSAEFSTDLRGRKKPAEVIEVTPGLPSRPPLPAALPLSIRCLVVGRMEDYQLKGLDIAAKALGIVTRVWQGGSPPKLVVRGVPLGADGPLLEKLRMDSAAPALDIVFRHYTADEAQIVSDLREASLVLMPSRREGFGLVALEAIACGVPTLVSANSGLAEMLRMVTPSLAPEWVIPTDDTSISMWSERIKFCLTARESAFKRATALRDTLRKKLDWTVSLGRLFSHIAVRPE